MMEPEDVQLIINAARDHFSLEADAEITIEANPCTLDEKKLAGYHAAGINRLSLGVQSFNDENLKRIGRLHRNKHTFDALEYISKSGFDNVNIDLIYGIPSQRPEDLMSDVETVIKWEPQHVSLYALTIEKDLGWQMPEPDSVADLYYMAIDALVAAGYEHYELSSLAGSGHQCVHNMGYWKKRDYIGFGPSAVSTIWAKGHDDSTRRWKNVEELAGYVNRLKKNELPAREYEELSPAEEAREEVMLSLRLISGMPVELVDGISAASIIEGFGDRLDDLIDAGFIEKFEGDGSMRLSRNSLTLANEIISRLF